MVKLYLSRKGIPFLEKNISEDSKAMEELLRLGYRATPVTIIGERHIIGYKPNDLDEALAALSP
jgi:glutaredoxin